MHVQVGHLSQVSTFDLFEFLSKFFFPKSKFPNSGCGLSASAAYTPVFTVCACILFSSGDKWEKVMSDEGMKEERFALFKTQSFF